MLTIPGHQGNANQNHSKIPPHSNTIDTNNTIHQEHHHQQMLARMWRKRNPHTLMVECEIVPLWKTIWRLLKKAKNRSAI
jgi:hypothetical protein